MRKLYLLFTFALLFVDAHVASAKLVLGEQKTTFAPGDKVLFQGCSNINSGTAWTFGSWIYAKSGATPTESIRLQRGGSETLPAIDNGYLFQLEDAQTPMTYNGKTYQGFYLYSPSTGKYAAPNGSNYFFKKNKERARVFYLVPSAEYALMKGLEEGKFESSYPGVLNALKPAFNLVIRTDAGEEGGGNGKDGYNYYALNRNLGDNVANATYHDWAAWLYVFEGEDVEDPNDILQQLSAKVEPIVSNSVAGTLPGFAANAEALETLKAAYTAATVPDADPSTAGPALEAAYETFKSYGQNGFIPLTDGFYYIRSAYDAFVNRDGIYRAMYVNGNGLYWTAEDQENKNYIWKVTTTDTPERFTIQSVSTLGYMKGTSTRSEHQKTVTDSTSCRVQQWNSRPKFTMGNGLDFHANASGGNASTIVAWPASGSDSPSTWTFIPVENFTEEELQGNIEQEIRNRIYAELLNSAQDTYSIALNFLPNTYPNDGLLKYVPAVETRAVSTEAHVEGGRIFCNNVRPGNIGLMCNGIWDDSSENFQTNWTESSKLPLHYFQFDLDEEIEYASFFVAAVDNNYMHAGPSIADVQVCQDTLPDNSGVWSTVKTLYLNYLLPGDQGVINGKEVVGGDVMYSEGVPLGGSYKHIRFVIRESIKGSQNKDNGEYTYTKNSGVAPFVRINEINIMKAQLDPDCQMVALKNDPNIAPLIAALEKEFQTASTISEPSVEDLARLQKVYDDFVAAFPNPIPLKNLIADTQEYMQNMYVGGVPGTYATQAELDEKLLAVQKAIEDAQADIDEQTLFTKSQVDEHIAAITAARQALVDGARPIDFTKWVRLYLTREYWVKNPDKKPENWPDNVAMYAPEEAESETTQVPFGLFNGDMATAFDWRFVPVKDGYFIQSRATGKFIGSGRVYENSRDWDPALSSVPAVFTVEPIGGGSFLITGKGMNGGNVTNYEGRKYLHGAFAPEKVTYWSDNHLGSNSGWEFEIQSDNAFDDNATEEMQNNALVTKHLVPNRLYTACYPTDVTIAPETEGMTVSAYKVAGKNADESAVYLEKIEGEEGMISIPAGTPFLYEIGEEGTNFTDYMYNAEEEANADMQLYYDFYPTLDAEENESLYVSAPQKADGITGIFTDQRIYKGHGLVSVYENSNAVLPYGIFFIEEDDETIESVLHRTEAYVDTKSAAVLGDNEVADYLALPIAGKIDNAIENVINSNDNAATVDVYTIEGVRVRANVAKANALKGLKPGLYIVNKTKVLVK